MDHGIFPLYPTSSTENGENDDEILFSASISTVNDVGVISDETLSSKSVIELGASNSKLIFYTMSKLSYIAFHLNTSNHFVEIKMMIYDNSNIRKTVTLSNKKTKVLIDESTCTLPLEIGQGWQYLSIDIGKVLYHCFRSSFLSCSEVSISGNCKIAKAYFQVIEHADIQLPRFLQVLNHEIS